MSVEGNGREPEPEPYEVLPALVPTQWDVRPVTLGEGTPDPIPAVMLQIRTPTGTHISFWPDDTAIGLALQLQSAGEVVRAQSSSSGEA